MGRMTVRLGTTSPPHHHHITTTSPSHHHTHQPHITTTSPPHHQHINHTSPPHHHHVSLPSLVSLPSQWRCTPGVGARVPGFVDVIRDLHPDLRCAPSTLVPIHAGDFHPRHAGHLDGPIGEAPSGEAPGSRTTRCSVRPRNLAELILLSTTGTFGNVFARNCPGSSLYARRERFFSILQRFSGILKLAEGPRERVVPRVHKSFWSDFGRFTARFRRGWCKDRARRISPRTVVDAPGSPAARPLPSSRARPTDILVATGPVCGAAGPCFAFAAMPASVTKFEIPGRPLPSPLTLSSAARPLQPTKSQKPCLERVRWLGQTRLDRQPFTPRFSSHRSQRTVWKGCQGHHRNEGVR